MSKQVTLTFEFPDEKTRSRWLEGVFDLYGSYGRAIWVDEELKLYPIYEESDPPHFPETE